MDRACRLEQSIRQRGFAVIDVRDDAEIARQFDSHESRTMRARDCRVNRTSLSFRPKWRNLLLFLSAKCYSRSRARSLGVALNRF